MLKEKFKAIWTDAASGIYDGHVEIKFRSQWDAPPQKKKEEEDTTVVRRRPRGLNP